jgi:quinol monooxygenase YgiN
MSPDGQAEADGSAGGVIVVALLKVKPGSADEAIEGFRPVIEGTHLEDGCRAYALHRDSSDPDTLVLVEKWDSQADLDRHFTQPHMAPLGELATTVLAEPPRILFCCPLVIGDAAKGML